MAFIARHSSTSTPQTSPTSPSATNAPSQSSPHTPPTPTLTPITINTPTGPTTLHIKRSFPNAKPTKLIAGLQRLLSHPPVPSPSNTVLPPSTSQPGPWILSSSGDAIHRTLTFPSPLHFDWLPTAIAADAETNNLNHHPHIAHHIIPAPPGSNINHPQEKDVTVAVVTCTTHNPHGLSLKDVKLADRIDMLLNEMAAGSSGWTFNPHAKLPSEWDAGVDWEWKAGGVRHGEFVGLWERLIGENERAARSARDDEESRCNVAGRGR